MSPVWKPKLNAPEAKCVLWYHGQKCAGTVRKIRRTELGRETQKGYKFDVQVAVHRDKFL